MKRYVINETIDVSVFNSWRQDSSYRPAGLEAWAERRSCDIRTLVSSVRADDPSVPVP